MEPNIEACITNSYETCECVNAIPFTHREEKDLDTGEELLPKREIVIGPVRGHYWLTSQVGPIQGILRKPK